MKQLLKKIRRIIDILIRKLHGHKYDCCSHIRMSCKRCPFNTDEVKEIVKEHKRNEEKGYFMIEGGKK